MENKTQLSIFVLVFFLSGCCGMKIVKCPDGRPVNVPKSQKCAEKLYKDVAKEFQSNIGATVNVVDNVTVGIDSFPIRTKVIRLKEKLNNESIRMELILKTSYYGLLVDPCDGSKAHQELLRSIAEKNYKIEELRIALQQKREPQDIEKLITDFNRTYKFEFLK